MSQREVDRLVERMEGLEGRTRQAESQAAAERQQREACEAEAESLRQQLRALQQQLSDMQPAVPSGSMAVTLPAANLPSRRACRFVSDSLKTAAVQLEAGDEGAPSEEDVRDAVAYQKVATFLDGLVPRLPADQDEDGGPGGEPAGGAVAPGAAAGGAAQQSGEGAGAVGAGHPPAAEARPEPAGAAAGAAGTAGPAGAAAGARGAPAPGDAEGQDADEEQEGAAAAGMLAPGAAAVAGEAGAGAEARVGGRRNETEGAARTGGGAAAGAAGAEITGGQQRIEAAAGAAPAPGESATRSSQQATTSQQGSGAASGSSADSAATSGQAGISRQASADSSASGQSAAAGTSRAAATVGAPAEAAAAAAATTRTAAGGPAAAAPGTAAPGVSGAAAAAATGRAAGRRQPAGQAVERAPAHKSSGHRARFEDMVPLKPDGSLDWSRVSILSAGMADTLLALRCGKAKQCRPHDRLELVEPLRLACQVSAYMYRHSHGWQEVPSDQAVHVSMRGLLPEAQQLHAAASGAPVFWQPSKQRLSGNFDCFDSLFAAGGNAAEEECGDSMLCGIQALKHAAGGHKQAKVLADGIREAATMRLAGQLDGLDPAVKQALNNLGMSVALGSKDGGAASTEFSTIQL